MASAAALRSLRGEGVVEFALHPGGYIRFGDDFILVATPRSPRGPLTVVAPGLHAAPLRPGDRAWIDDALHVGPHTIPLTSRRRGRARSSAPAGAPRSTSSHDPRSWPPGLHAARRRRRGPHPGRRRHPAGLRAFVARRRYKRSGPLYVRRWGSRTSGVRRGGSCRRSSRGCSSRRDAETGAAKGEGAVAVGIELRRCNALGRRERNVNEIGPNFIARPYRGVSVQDVETLEDERAARARARAARVSADRVHRRDLRRRAGARAGRARGRGRHPGRRARRADPRAARTRSRSSTTSRSTPATRRSWRGSAKDRRVTVVQGRFQHVNFIYEPAPLRIRVLEVVPPHPPKLLEMAQAVLDFDEDLPPVALDFEAIDMRELARGHPADHYLFPCRCAGLDLDARGRLPRRRPAARRRLDAGRLRALAPDPRGALRRRPARARRLLPAADAAERRADAAQVLPARARDRAGGQPARQCPWGASLEEVREALHRLVAA